MKHRFSLLLLLALLVALLPGGSIAQQGPSITITIPVEGETTSPVEVVVVGTGTALPENNVVVQALDEGGNVLAEMPTTVDAEAGGTGEWRAVLQLGVDPGTAGSIYAFSSSPADGSILAQDRVSVTFGAVAVPPIATVEPTEPVPPTVEAPTPTPTATPTPPPALPANITIAIPLNGETVSPVEVVVVGTGSALPENNVVVQALDEDGNVMDETATTVNAPLGGSGEWRASLRPNVAPGSPGSIVAFAASPADGSILARDSVDVAYGSAPPTPTPTPPPADITITIPVQGEVISPYEVVVVGSGSALPENNVVVQALDNAGRVLDEEATSYTSPVGGSGEWRATLRYDVEPGTPGAIVAYSPSPADGSILAQDSVNVVYGTEPEPPAAPFIVIQQPQDGSTVSTTGGMVVRGEAGGLFEGNVVVRVRDSANRTIAQQATTASNGQWSTTFNFLIADGTRGSIYAFSPSPVDGSTVADDLVRVTFASSCQVRGDWPVYVVQPGDTLFSIAARTGSTVGELIVANCLPNPTLITPGQELHVPRLPGAIEEVLPPAVTIEEPGAGETLLASVPFAATGTATTVMSGTVFLRVLDPVGQVLASAQVEQSEEPDDEGTWSWETEVTVPDVAPSTRATLFVYALDPSNGSIVVSTATPVIFGEDDERPYITIAEPLPYTMVELGETVVVSGTGRGLFENNVVVQAVDVTGDVLAMRPTIMETDEPGGEGTWSVELPVDVVTRGRLRAFHENAEDGSIMAEAAVDVRFGDPRDEASFAAIVFPLPGAVVTNQTPFLAVTGYAGGLPNDTVFLLLQDDDGEVLQLMPVEVDPVTGFWWFAAELEEEILEDGDYTVRVIGSSPLSGRSLVSDRVGLQARADDLLVTGEVTYRVRSALPPDAVVSVSIVNASLADAPPAETLLGQQVIPTGGRQVPIPFAVGYNSAEVDERMTYVLTARIEDGDGNLLFINTEGEPVITRGNPTSDVEVVVDPVG